MSMNQETEQKSNFHFYNEVRFITGNIEFINNVSRSNRFFNGKFVGLRYKNSIAMTPRDGYYKRGNFAKLRYNFFNCPSKFVVIDVNDLSIVRLSIHYWNNYKIENQELYKSFFPYKYR